MNRRRLLGSLAAAPLAALAPAALAAASKRVAMLWLTTEGMPPDTDPQLVKNLLARGSKEQEARKFAAPLEPHGFRLGRNLEVLWFDFPFFGDWDVVVPRAAARMIAAKPDCIVAVGTTYTGYIARATRTIPIVTGVADPVVVGFAQSIGRPGGNITGLATKLGVDIKTLEFLMQFMPGMSCAAWIGYREQVTHAPVFEAAARDARLGVRRILVEDPRPDGWKERLVAEFTPLRAAGCTGALVSVHNPYFDEVLKLALQHRIAIAHGGAQEDVERDGVLLHYYASDDDETMLRRRAAIIAKVLNGQQPANIPFEGPSRYVLVINLRTARKIGATISPQILVLADRIIE